MARCTEARIETTSQILTNTPRINILEDLEKETPPGLFEWDIRVMVAAQYIPLAGPVVEEELVHKPAKKDLSNCMDKWQLWAGKLKILAEKEQLAPHAKSAVVEAQKKMISLRPELFFGVGGREQTRCLIRRDDKNFTNGLLDFGW